MYVCVCKAVTDRQIQEAAQGGARTLRDLRRVLGVTADCGRCASSASYARRTSPPAAGECHKDPHQSPAGASACVPHAA